MGCPRGTAAVQGHAGYCRISSGALEGVITNESGIVDSHVFEGVGTDASRFMSRYQGEEAVQCSGGAGLSDVRYALVPGATFSPAGVAKLRELFGGLAPGAHGVVLCMDSMRAGAVGINMGRAEVVRPGIEKLIKEGASVLPEADRGNYDALVQALRTSFRNNFPNEPALPESSSSTAWNWFKDIGLALLSLGGVILAFGIGVPWLHHRFGPPNGGGPGNPLSGGGNSGGTPPVSGNAGNPNAAARNALPDVAQGILAFHGANGLPGVSVPGAVPVTGAPVAGPGILPVPVIPAPVAVPAPVVAPAPVVVPRLVPVVP